MARVLGVLLLASVVGAEEDVRLMTVQGIEFPTLIGQTATYQIEADCDEPMLRKVATLLEDLHRAFMKEFGAQAERRDGEGRMRVRLYATRASLAAHTGGTPGRRPGGLYHPKSRTLHAGLEQPDGDDWEFVLKHEATHQLLHARLGIGGGEPGRTSAVWFNEGFASYWAMTEWKEAEAVTGGVPAALLGDAKVELASEQGMKLRDLVAARQNPLRMRSTYALGWALCHFLRHSAHREKFAGYLEKERNGEITWEAFLAAFEVKDAEAFEREFRDHVEKLK